MTELYLHIPFCKKKCFYCNFCSIPSQSVPDDYVRALVNEIRSYPQTTVNTVFFGGGTPSLLSPFQLEEIIRAIVKTHRFLGQELTVESNPDTLTLEKLQAYKSLGVNRISLGVQSLNDDILLKIGRTHDSYTALKNIENAVSVFGNVNADMIVGLPAQTQTDVFNDINKLISKGVTHVSVYSLMKEKGTKLYKMIESNQLTTPTDDETVNLYDTAFSVLKDNGYERYEISNFSKSGYSCKHNSNIWQMGEYIGVGTSAHSFFNGKRYYNKNNIPDYVKNQGLGQRVEEGSNTLQDRKIETVMLGLRTSLGVDLIKYKNTFGISFQDDFKDELRDKEISTACVMQKDRLTIKDEYLYISNYIIEKLLDRFL